MKIIKIWFLTSLFISSHLIAGEVSVAVAGNFFKPLKTIAAQFEASSGNHVNISVAATGKLYAQIVNGAPFEVFLAADQKRPASLIEQKLADPSSVFTYAQGQLVLWSKKPGIVDQQGHCLHSPNLEFLAIANPKAAPYGAEAVSALKKLGVYPQLAAKIVQGQNIGQTYQYISSGNVDMGIIALSQVSMDGQIKQGSYWLLPADLYQPIKQDALLLNKGKNNPVALAFLNFLRTPQALQTIRSFGYKVGA